MISHFESLANLLRQMQVEPKPMPKKTPPKQPKSDFRFTKRFCDCFKTEFGQGKATKREGKLIFMVSKSGIKSWRLDELAGRKSMTIGYYPAMSINEARKRRDEILRGI